MTIDKSDMSIVTDTVPNAQENQQKPLENPLGFEPLRGIEAATAFWNGVIMPSYGDFDYEKPKHFWLVGTDLKEKKSFYQLGIQDDPHGWFTKNQDENKPESRVRVGNCLSLEEIIKRCDGQMGLTWIPSCPPNLPLLSRFNGSKIVWGECDLDSFDKQWDNVKLLIKYGLIPIAIVHSGGKSLHIYFLLDRSVNADYLRYLNLLFAELFNGDRKIATNTVNQMKSPGVDRVKIKDGVKTVTHQTLEYLNSDSVYSPYEIEGKFQKLYEDLGVNFESFEDYQKRLQVESEKLAKQKIDLKDYDESDIKKAVIELIINDSIPRYDDCIDSYQIRLNCAIALTHLGFSQEECYSLFSNLFEGAHFGWNTLYRYHRDNPIGSLICQLRKLLGDNEIKFPNWFNEKYSIGGEKNQDDFNVDKWKQEKALTVKKLKTFTPDITVKKRISEYSPNELKNILLENGVKLSGDGVLDGIILNVKAPTGAGKTHLVLAIEEYYKSIGVGGALEGYRNGLLEQTCARSNHNIIHINHNKDEFNDLRDTMWFGGCVDSILKPDPEWWEDKIIVLDEVVSVLNHLLFSDTLKNERAEKIDRFIHVLRVARGVICLDGHNADFIASFFKGLTDKPVINLLNDYAIARPDIKFLEGTIKNQKLKKNDKSPFLKHIKDTIPHNPITVASDSKIFLKSLTEILESLGHKCLLVTSETIRLKAVKDFIKDPDKSIQENRYDAVLFSPSAESGLSVDIKGYFKALYAFYFGVLGTDAQQQMIIRIRDIECPRYVWLRSHSIVTDSTFEKRYDDKALLLSLLTNEVNHLSLEYKSETLANLKDKIENVPTQLMELAEHFRLIAQHERFNFRESFCNAVVENGYSLERVTLETDKESKQELKAKTKAIKERESLEIFNASDKYLYGIAPMLGENATDADRAAFEKAKILTDLPNLEFEDLWSPDFVKFLKFDRIMAITHRRLYVLANNLELAQKLSDRRYQSYIQKDKLCPWEMKPEYLQARAIAQSGILELITSPAQLLTADHPMVKDIVRKCKKAAIYKPLGRSPGKDAMKFISHLLGRLGYTLKEQNYKTPDGKKARAYVLDYDDKVKTQPYFDVIDRLLTARFERAVLAPKASTIPKNEPKIDQIDFEHLDPPQTHAGYASEAVPDHLNKIEKNDDHLEPIQPPLTTAQSTTANNDVPDVGDLVICDEFPEHHILEIVGLHYGDKGWVRIRGDWWPAGETELSHISHLKKVERAIA